MKITAIQIKDFKRIKDVKLAVDADRSIILIGGRNGQGKSSTLDALTAAFGGKKSQPSDPVRHGADEAEIVVELDGGAFTVKRCIQPNGESVLEVRDRMGSIKAPQEMLNTLVGSRFLDPLAFLSLPAKEQRATLMRLIDGADRIAGLNEKRTRAFDKRTEVGRDLTKAEGELARLPVAEVGAPIDVAALTIANATIAAEERERDRLASVLRETETNAHLARAERGRAVSRAEDLEAQIAELQVALKRTHAAIPPLDEAAEQRTADERAAKDQLVVAEKRIAELAPERARIEADVARADAHNRAVFAAEAQAKRRVEVIEDVTKLAKEREELTKVIDTIDERKAKVLAEAKLPVENLGVTDDGIELAGVPFAQASGAEKLRVSLALAIAASPKLADVWIRDGALLDEESLDLVAKYAEANGKRVWVERVGTRDPGVIVIQDGQVVP